MDQRTVESLLRRLVERVEESERRYSEALDELHARLDQLSQTTDAARATGAPEDSATLDRLHEQVSSLARRFEPQSTNPLDDFERLGKALSANLDFTDRRVGRAVGRGRPADPPLRAFPSAPILRAARRDAAAGAPGFRFQGARVFLSRRPLSIFRRSSEAVFDKRLSDMAHQLEHSLGTVMPAATIEALNTRLDEIASQLSQALRQAPKLDNLASVEKQLSEMGQQLSRAEAQLARMTGIEDQLRTLIERFDAAPDVLEEIATKAASEAARLVAETSKPGASEERLDAMHRDLVAMSDKSRASDERLAGTLQAVHEFAEAARAAGREGQRCSPLQPPKPQAPFAERVRAEPAFTQPPGLPPFQHPGQPPMAAGAAQCAGRRARPSEGEIARRAGLAARIADFQESEPLPSFGRGKRGALGRGGGRSRRVGPAPCAHRNGADAEFDHDDLVAAARRAAQAAALRAEERTGGGRARRSSATIASRQRPWRRCAVEAQALAAHDRGGQSCS